MTRTLWRITYRAIVYLHPVAFKERFGAEMLWIFEEQNRDGATARLLVDGLESLMRQRWASAGAPQRGIASRGMFAVETGIGAGRFAQGGVMASIVLCIFMLALGQRVPSPVNFRHSERLFFYAIMLQGPARGAAQPSTPQHSGGARADIQESVR